MGQGFTYLEILTPKSSPWTVIALLLPTGAARSTCIVVDQGSVWEPQIENPELSLDLPPYKIKNHLGMIMRGKVVS